MLWLRLMLHRFFVPPVTSARVREDHERVLAEARRRIDRLDQQIKVMERQH